MTARALYTQALPFLLSRNAAFRLLGIDPSGPVAKELIRSGRLVLVDAGNRKRLRLEDVQRVAREGFTAAARPSRPRSAPRGASAPGVGARIRAIKVNDLGGES